MSWRQSGVCTAPSGGALRSPAGERTALGADRDVLGVVLYIMFELSRSPHSVDISEELQMAGDALSSFRQALSHQTQSGVDVHPPATSRIVLVAHKDDLVKFRQTYQLQGVDWRVELADAGKSYVSATVPEEAVAPLLRVFNHFAATRLRRLGVAYEHVPALPPLQLILHRPSTKDKPGRDLGPAWAAKVLLGAARFVVAARLRPSTAPGDATVELLLGVSTRHQAVQLRELAEDAGLRVRCAAQPTAVARLSALDPMGFGDAVAIVAAAVEQACGPTVTFRPSGGAEWRVPRASAAALTARLRQQDVAAAVAGQDLALPDP